MHVYIVFAHPSTRSFSRSVLDAFAKGLRDAGHSYEIGDLYEMGFQAEMNEAQYLRETSGDPDLPVPRDVEVEQAKIDRADGLAFIYPVWWSDCPAKLKGWFDRVLSCGYAYLHDDEGSRATRMNIGKALVLCSAGHTAEHLEKTGIAESMRRVFLNDRLLGVGVKQAHMEILGGMMPLDDTYREQNLYRAYELGRSF
ncbi:MAG: NADPH:quinone reductase [Actinobacteria bacterium RBG_16_64_13]|nr:MAG: NADPH:quinone reductase [Actinobacteria bacterium RBG_16_64_13]